jgi:hypothetical protein
MTPQEAKQIIDVLARGIDPATGELISEDSPLNGPHVIRALFIAAQALEAMASKPARPRAALPGKAGKPWGDDEDRRLLARFDAGTPIALLAQDHERTLGAINSRLMKHGRLQIDAQDSAAPDDNDASPPEPHGG